MEVKDASYQPVSIVPDRVARLSTWKQSAAGLVPTRPQNLILIEMIGKFTL